MTKTEREKLRALYWELRNQSSDLASAWFSAGVSAITERNEDEKKAAAQAEDEEMYLLLDELRELAEESWQRSS